MENCKIEIKTAHNEMDVNLSIFDVVLRTNET